MTDAVVIGSGPNGLVAANLLADAGWSVLVLEAQPTIGGAVRTDTEVADGFRHDTFSAFYPLAAASDVIASLRLDAYGLRWVHAPAVLGHPLTDGSWALIEHDADRTAAGLDGLHPGDGAAWLRLVAAWRGYGDDLVEALLTPFPPVRAGARLAVSMPRAGGLSALAMPLMPVRRLAQRYFAGEGRASAAGRKRVARRFRPGAVGFGGLRVAHDDVGTDCGVPRSRGWGQGS